MTPNEREMKLLMSILLEDIEDPNQVKKLLNTPAGRTLMGGQGKD
tara:strand:+ start:501 stop:635 length:135 start_codon:yes stop_codon:yes gene_type:complete